MARGASRYFSRSTASCGANACMAFIDFSDLRVSGCRTSLMTSVSSRGILAPTRLGTVAGAADAPRLYQEGEHSLTQGRKRRIGRRDARYQYNVEPTGHSILFQTNRFAHAAAYPVTAHGVARAPSHGDADARHRQSVGPRIQRGYTAGQSPPLTICQAERLSGAHSINLSSQK